MTLIETTGGGLFSWVEMTFWDATLLKGSVLVAHIYGVGFGSRGFVNYSFLKQRKYNSLIPVITKVGNPSIWLCLCFEVLYYGWKPLVTYYIAAFAHGSTGQGTFWDPLVYKQVQERPTLQSFGSQHTGSHQQNGH